MSLSRPGSLDVLADTRHRVFQFSIVHNGISLEHRIGFVPCDFHGSGFVNVGTSQVAGG